MSLVASRLPLQGQQGLRTGLALALASPDALDAFEQQQPQVPPHNLLPNAAALRGLPTRCTSQCHEDVDAQASQGPDRDFSRAPLLEKLFYYARENFCSSVELA